MQRRVCSLIKMSPPIANDRGLLSASGATVPTDGTDGYQASCYFQDTTNGIIYINEGSVTSCEFNSSTTGGASDVLAIGAFSSVTAGSGIAISSSQTGAAKIYSDDNGVNIAASVRGLLSRFLLTIDQTGGSIRAIMGQLKFADLIDVTTGVYTASQGYVELAGTSIVKGYAHLSCFDASLEIASGETLTVNQYGKAAGLYVETTGSGTITVDSGGLMAGVVITKASGAASWPIGVLVSGADVIQGINVGSFSSTDASVLGVTVATAISAANRFYTDDGATAIVNTGVNDTRGVLSRLLARADHTANPLRLFALEGQLKGYCASSGGAAKWDNEMVAGVYGYMELERASGTMTLGGYGFTAGVMSCVENSGVVTVNTNHVLSGFCAVSKITSALVATGKTAAFHAAIYDGTNWSSSAEDEQAWEYGLLVANGAAGIGVYIGTCTTGISINGTITTGITISAVSLTDGIKISGTTPVDGIEISSVCSGHAINISGTQTATFFDATFSATGSSKIDGMDLNFSTATTYGAAGDRWGGNGNMEAFLAIGDDAAASVVSGAGSHLGQYINLSYTATAGDANDLVGGLYAVVSYGATETTGKMCGITSHIRNPDQDISGANQECNAIRALMYTGTGGETQHYCGILLSVLDMTTTKSNAQDIIGMRVQFNVANDTAGGNLSGLVFDNVGTVEPYTGLWYLQNEWTYAIVAADGGATPKPATDSGTVSTAAGAIAVKIGGSVRYIPLYTTYSS